MAQLKEPSVEHARRIVQERLTRIKLREDQTRADRGDREQLRQVQAGKTAQLRAIRLSRAAADTLALAREAARNVNFPKAAARPRGDACVQARPINARGH